MELTLLGSRGCWFRLNTGTILWMKKLTDKKAFSLQISTMREAIIMEGEGYLQVNESLKSNTSN